MPASSPDPDDDTPQEASAWLIDLGWQDRYELLKVIGRGGMGQVWKARDRDSDGWVALKVVDPAREGDDHLLARLEIEAATLMRLTAAGQHDHIVPVLDFKANESHACMVMAFIPGQDLLTWCDAQRLDLRARVALVETVARASGWCHQQGVVHRDLKPSNILVNISTRQPVIVDFSIAKSAEHLPLTMTGEALGTAPYMAPEQLDTTRGKVTPGADVYALGATLYELLTHVHPHPGNMPQVMERHRDEVRPARPSVLNAQVPKDLDSICLKALAHRPVERYVDGTQFADDLAHFLAGEPVLARPLSTPAYLWRQARRRPVQSLALIGCVLLAAVIVWAEWQMRLTTQVSALQKVVTDGIKSGQWNEPSLKKAGDAVEAMARLDASSAGEARQTWHDGVVKNIKDTLAESRLQEGAAAWITTALAWMQNIDPPQAEQLRIQLNGRLQSWQVQAEAKPPFTDFGGLFPQHNVLVNGDALVPSPTQGSGIQKVMVKQPLLCPCDVAASFTPPEAGFEQISLNFELQKVSTRVVLARPARVPKEVLRFMEGADSPEAAFVLYLERRKHFVRGLVIPDAALVHRRFFLEVKVENDHIFCELDHHWAVRMEEDFIIPRSVQQNSLMLAWPMDLRLNALTISNREEKQMASPLELGDVLAAQGRWTEAQRKFDVYRGDPIYGDEATWKAAFAAYQQDQVREALADWESLAGHPASVWREFALYELWKHYALHADLATAAPYLKQLPAPAKASPALHAHITPQDRKALMACYEKLGEGLYVLHPVIDEVEQGVKAFGLLDVPDLDTAATFALARHCNGINSEASELWNRGLADVADRLWSGVQAGNSLAGGGPALLTTLHCLDGWCRMVSTEQEPKLQEWLGKWHDAYPGSATVQAASQLQKAREEGRAGHLESALALAVSAASQVNAPASLRVSAFLVAGQLQQKLGHAELAALTWRAGQDLAQHDLPNPTTQVACDLLAIHTLLQNWTPDSAKELLFGLLGKTLPGQAGIEMQAQCFRTLLADPDFITALNSQTADEAGKKLLAGYVLQTAPLGPSVKSAVMALLQRYFLLTAAKSSPDPEWVAITVDLFLQRLATDSPEAPAFFAFMEAWCHPVKNNLLLASSPTAPSPLRARLQWLLAERCLSLGDKETARLLLQAAKESEVLDLPWRQHIDDLLKGL